jgi:hypothetical protein
MSSAALYGIHFTPRANCAMSFNTGSSVFDQALGCIGQRIASILKHPVKKEEHYVVSLHNEVVSII